MSMDNPQWADYNDSGEPDEWADFTRRTDDPKLSWIETQLDGLGIPNRRHGNSFHAPILQVDSEALDLAWTILPLAIDNLPDDHRMFMGADLKKIEALAMAIWKNTCQIKPKLGYDRVIELITLLANMCHEYEGETEDWLHLNEHWATPDAIIVGAHWMGAEWHGGQNSPEYAMISATGQCFSPNFETGPMENSQEEMFYLDLCSLAEENQKAKTNTTS